MADLPVPRKLTLSKKVLEWKRFNPDDMVLDIGGECRYYVDLCDIFHPSMPFILNINEKRLGSVKNTFLRDGRKTEFADSSWDVITCYDVIEHLDEPADMVQEIYRILKPGGIFILSTPNLACIYNRLALMLGFTPFSYNPTKYFVGSPIGSRAGQDCTLHHKSVFTFLALKQFLEVEGFTCLTCKGFSYDMDRLDLHQTVQSRKLRGSLNMILPQSFREGLLFLCQK